MNNNTSFKKILSVVNYFPGICIGAGFTERNKPIILQVIRRSLCKLQEDEKYPNKLSQNVLSYA